MRTNDADDMLTQATTLIKASRDCIQTLVDHLRAAADALQGATDCPACGTPNYLSLDHHDPGCVVREIRALLSLAAETPATSPLCRSDEPIVPPSRWANMEAGEVQHLRPEDVGLPPEPGERPAKRPLPPMLSDRETSLYAAAQDLTARINSAAVNHEVPVAVKVPILGDLVDAWHRARPVSCVVDWPELGRPEAPPETFAVIRYVGKAATCGGVNSLDAGICAPLGEAEWDLIGKDARGWKLVCRGIPSFDMAQSIAWTLSSRPFSE